MVENYLRNTAGKNMEAEQMPDTNNQLVQLGTQSASRTIQGLTNLSQTKKGVARFNAQERARVRQAKRARNAAMLGAALTVVGGVGGLIAGSIATQSFTPDDVADDPILSHYAQRQGLDLSYKFGRGSGPQGSPELSNPDHWKGMREAARPYLMAKHSLYGQLFGGIGADLYNVGESTGLGSMLGLIGGVGVGAAPLFFEN